MQRRLGMIRTLAKSERMKDSLDFVALPMGSEKTRFW